MKILIFRLRINKIIRIKIPCENYSNHRILCEKHKTYENHRIPCENNENRANHRIQLENHSNHEKSKKQYIRKL